MVPAHTVDNASMNTSTAVDAEQAPPRFTADPNLPGVSFGRSFRAEIKKLWSLRSTLWLSLTSVALGVLFGLIAILDMENMAQIAEDGEVAAMGGGDVSLWVLQIPLASLYFSMILLGCIGVIAMTTEFGTGSIRSSLSAVPGRTTFYLSKLLALTVITALVTAVIIVISVGIVLPFTGQHDLTPDFGDGELWTMLATHWVGVVLAALLGFGLGTLLRSTAGGIVTLALLLFVVPMVLMIVWQITGMDWIETLETWQFSSLFDSFAMDVDPGRTAAGLGMAAWTAAAVVPGWLTFMKRDV